MNNIRLGNGTGISFALCFLLIGSIYAQQQKVAPQKASVVSKGEMGKGNEEKVKLKSVPKAVQNTIQKETQGAHIIGISKEVDEGRTFYEVETKMKGFGKDMLIDDTGKLTEIEEEIALASLPANVQAEVKNSIGKAKLLKLEALYNSAKVRTAYEAQVDRAGKKAEISMGLDGKILPPARK